MIAAVGKLDTTAGAPPILLEMRPDGLQIVFEQRAGERQMAPQYLSHAPAHVSDELPRCLRLPDHRHEPQPPRSVDDSAAITNNAE